MVTAAGVTAAGSLLSGLGGAFSSFFGGRSKGPSTYDTIETQRQYAKAFPGMAKSMGVSRHALLGHQMPSGSSGGMIRMKPDIGKGMARMGQDVQRGVQSYLAVKEADDNAKLKASQAKLYDAQATAILNQQTQNPTGVTEENLPSDYLTYDKQLEKSGITQGEQPTIMRSGAIRMYPGQNLSDLISEDVVSKAKFYYDTIKYSDKLSRSASGNKLFFHAQKNEMQERLGRKVYAHRTYVPILKRHIITWNIYPPGAKQRSRPLVIRKRVPRQ